MGIYQDIQDEVKDAMNNDLSDATATLTVFEEIKSLVYDPIAGAGATYTPVKYIMDCIILGDKEEKKDEADTNTQYINLLILDSMKTIDEFKTGLKILVRGNNYEIGKVEIDPTGATYELSCRRI